MAREMLAGSTEYLETLVLADVDLVNQPVAISLDRGATWLTAGWEPAPSHFEMRVIDNVKKTFYARTARVLLGASPALYPMPAKGEYPVWTQVSDTPEVLNLPAGTLAVLS